MTEKIYLNERVPTSNRTPDIQYHLCIKTATGEFTHNLFTVDDLEAFVYSVRKTTAQIISADRINTATGERVPFIPETRQERTDRENREHCKRIAKNLEAYANGSVYRCPECGDTLEWDGDSYNDETGLYHLPCGCETPDEPEQLTLYDYFADALDIEYRVSGRDADDLRSVRVMVACGGPNIYIDTSTKNVELYWWGDRASYPIAYDVIDDIEAWASELWGCL